MNRLPLLLSLLLLLSPCTRASAEAMGLPDLGDRSSIGFSATDEHIVGRAMVHSLYTSGQLLDDPLLNEYLQQLSARLLSSSTLLHGGFHFYLIDDPNINAFAMPGGHIAVHSGLLLKSNNEDELAAVLAHEIAHISQQHLARRFESLKQLNTGFNIAMLAAILLSASRPELAEAAVLSSMGGQQQMALGYSREHEHEADRVGITLLANAGFDPHSMAGFFRKLEQVSRYNIGVLPEFLSTHPITRQRIVEAEHRAASLPASEDDDESAYRLAKARLSALTQYANSERLHVLERLMRTRNDAPSRYAYALALIDDGRAGEALPLMQALVKAHPQRIAYRLGEARSLLESSRGEAALERYRQALSLYPGNRSLNLAYATALLRQGQAEEARRLLNRHLRARADDASAYRLLARVEGALNNPVASNMAMAEHLYLFGDTQGAVGQLENAMRHADINFYQQERVDSRLSVLKEQVRQEVAWEERQ